MKDPKVILLPCSGIGSPLGTVGRQAAYRVVEKLRPGKTAITCLALLDNQDREALQLVRDNPCLALDACGGKCAEKIIKAAGGQFRSEFSLSEIARQHRHLKPEGVLELGKMGLQLVEIAAQTAALAVDRLCEEPS